ncbi:52 kDa repressor of the inhibitor of the protein kinase-like [Ixodes scapularis]|uniref:52 kDa repressor of the inhibitor of the protein kinase-like n=1 Tax=Ixodes scapularis TaxID=6945 RepID=UPI001C38DB5D|nr:52 kDa repressor of the inhibitor of the protein kinase-like [Ixodes scapularis]
MKRASLQKIDKFFSPAPKKALQIPVEGTDEEASVAVFSALPLNEEVAAPGDIGNFVGRQVDDCTKRHLLETHWCLSENYSFPYSVHRKNGKDEKRYVGHSHLSKFKWLVLPDSHKGLYCKYCALFATGSVGGYQKNIPLQKLVTKPLTSFVQLLGKDGDLPVHDASKYHKEAMRAGKNFLACVRAPEKDVANQICSQRLHQVNHNRNRLLPIIESIIFLGRQGIPLRGHRDDGTLLERSSEPSLTSNEGNFRDIHRFRVSSGDTELQKRLASTSFRATYISKTTQNELIKCCGDEVLATLIQWVHGSGAYSIMFDETTDVSHTSQLSLVLRYVHKNMVREDFVQFVDPRSDSDALDVSVTEPILTGKVLGKQVVKMLKDLGLDLERCVGVATDGCSVMVSELCGAVSEIKRCAPNAVHCPCFNHALNLSLSKSSRVQAFRNAVGIMEIISFFTASLKRNIALKNALGHQLKGLCETRWVERHDSVIQFRDSLGCVSTALDAIASWREMQSAAKAKALRVSLGDGEFLMAIVCLSDLLAHTLPLSRLYQKECVDVHTARNTLTDTIAVLTAQRQNCEEVLRPLYEQAVALADELDTELKLPRITKRQTHWSNPPALDSESFYRTSVYIPLLDNVLADPRSRENEARVATDIAQRYCSFIGAPITAKVIQAELRLWREKWKRESEDGADIPSTAVQALYMCDSEVFPSIRTFLQILATLPVSVASAERSFSTLRRLKTWLRSQMSDARLTGLALLHTQRDISVDCGKVIDRFANGSHGRRRLEFVV